MKHRPTAEEMLVRMAGLCAGSEQCASDIRNKILKKGFSVEETEKIISYLQENKYIDDARYARAYAADKVRFSGWGKMKVRMGLRAKGMSDPIISQALAYIYEKDYSETLEKVMLAKARYLNLQEVKDRQRLYRHLASRGFETPLIISAMRTLMNNQNERDFD